MLYPNELRARNLSDQGGNGGRRRMTGIPDVLLPKQGRNATTTGVAMPRSDRADTERAALRGPCKGWGG